MKRAEEDRRKGDLKALYEVTWTLSGYFQSSCKLMKKLHRTAGEEIHKWKEYFESVLNHEEPSNPPVQTHPVNWI